MSHICITADWHLRGDAPVCRVHPEKWLEEQQASVEEIYRICDEYDASQMWILGDLFHRSRSSTECVVQALKMLSRFHKKVDVFALCGNHDLLQHAYTNVEASSIGAVLQLVNELTSLNTRLVVDDLAIAAYPFGMEPEYVSDCDIWITHQLTFPDEESRPMPDIGVLAEDLLARSDAKLILTGDYHHAFIKEFGDRRVAACGCINIQASDMIGYEPSVFILDTGDLSLTRVPFPAVGECVECAAYELRKEMDDYAEKISALQIPKLDYIANVESAASKAGKAVYDKVHDVLSAYGTSINV